MIVTWAGTPLRADRSSDQRQAATTGSAAVTQTRSALSRSAANGPGPCLASRCGHRITRRPRSNTSRSTPMTSRPRALSTSRRAVGSSTRRAPGRAPSTVAGYACDQICINLRPRHVAGRGSVQPRLHMHPQPDRGCDYARSGLEVHPQHRQMTRDAQPAGSAGTRAMTSPCRSSAS